MRDFGRRARVEVAPEEVARLLAEPMKGRIEAGLARAGFESVEIDPEGYRPGKLHGARMDEST